MGGRGLACEVVAAGDPVDQARALDRQQWPEAERLAREALDLALALGRKELIASDCWRLAQALARQGRGAEGRCHAERAVAIFTKLRSPELAKAQAALAECLSGATSV